MTGIKVVDLLAPYAKGGKIGLFGGAGVGKTVSYGFTVFISILTLLSVCMRSVSSCTVCTAIACCSL